MARYTYQCSHCLEFFESEVLDENGKECYECGTGELHLLNDEE